MIDIDTRRLKALRERCIAAQTATSLDNPNLDNPNNAKDFQSIVKEFLELLPGECLSASKYGASTSTIERWGKGTSVPYPSLHRSIYITLQKQIELNLYPILQ